MDDKSKKCLRDVLTKELEDLKVRAKMMEDIYMEDTLECKEKIEEINRRYNEVEIAIKEENKRFIKKLSLFVPIAVLLGGIIILVDVLIVKDVMSVILSLGGEVSLSALYFYVQYKKSENIQKTYRNKLIVLSMDKQDYENIMKQMKNEYLKSLSLVTEKEEEIAKLDDMDVIYEVDDVDKNIVDKRPLTRKLERK